MLMLRRGEHLRARIFAGCRKYLATQSQPAVKQTESAAVTATETDPEYTAVAEYPEILDLSFRSRKIKKATDWYEEIRNVPTIEEKMIKINMPRFYGYKVVDFNDEFVPYNALGLTQHYTRTAIEELQLPAAAEDKQLDAFVEAARPHVVGALELAHDFFRNKYPNANDMDAVEHEQKLTQIVVEQLNRVLLLTLAADYAHLQEVEVDYNPRHEAFWAVGGIEPPKNVVKSKKGHDWQKDYANDPVDRLVQYTGSPYLALRHRFQLPTWKSDDEIHNPQLAKQLPRYNFDARTLGYRTKYQHAVNVPGFWPGSPNGFGCISYQSRTHLLQRPSTYPAEDHIDALLSQAIKSSYAWLLAQANYNGFNTYNELTYPMNTQTIVTNGREWSFYEYQLNTLLVHGTHVDTNERVNYCRGSKPLPLYEQITPEGKCIGLNDTVLRQLLRFYTNVPNVQRTIDELQPYCAGPELRRLSDYSNPDQREFLENTFKHIVSKRARHLEIPEIYLWEKLYKIDNKTRQMDAKRRFFELNINPWRRTLDQHDKVYIPRKVRPGGPKSRDRFKKTYYP